MYYDAASNLIFSPSDLNVFLESPFASMMDRHQRDRPADLEPDEQSATDEVLSRRGDEHEANILRAFQEEGLSIEEIPDAGTRNDASYDLTSQALAGDADVIYQAVLRVGNFAGIADFLIRDRETGLWQVWDAKLARTMKPKFVVQLCCYAHMLSEMGVARPITIGVMLGDGARVDLPTEDYFDYYLEVRRAFLEHMDSYDPGTLPEPTGFGSAGLWQSAADEMLRAVDHLSLVANIRQTQVKRLTACGISTVAELATTNLSDLPGIGDDVFERLRRQARLQIETADNHMPRYEVLDPNETPHINGLQLLPPASANDVFFDMEGYPLIADGLEYLFGAAYTEGRTQQFRDWWACRKNAEQTAFEGFIDWVYDRWQSDRTMHVYHYASYEVTALKRLMATYASRETEIDNLLRADVFVDLYQVVRQGLCVGTPSYSIKDIERLYRPQRTEQVGTAADSIVFFDRWLESGESTDWRESEILRSIRDYNEVDCVSTLELADWLRDRQTESGIKYVPPGNREEPDSQLGPRTEAERLSIELLESLPDDAGSFSPDDRIAQMLGWLLEYHRREAKPDWWTYFNREKQSPEELYEDRECLAGLVRTDSVPWTIARSLAYEYSFDTTQESKVRSNKRYNIARDMGSTVHVESIDYDKGIVVVKKSKSQPAPPDELDLVPGKPPPTKTLIDSIYRTSRLWRDEGVLQPAIRTLVERKEPEIIGRAPGESVIGENAEPDSEIVKAVIGLSDSLLCIQGPPGTGKTRVSARCIVELIGNGKRVGVMSNGHDAIENLLLAVTKAAAEVGLSFRGVKIGGGDKLANDSNYSVVSRASEYTPGVTGQEDLVGGTTWAFAHDDWVTQFDYLFVDEAGQVSLGHLVAAAPAARNIVIVGDQMQLEQPVKGSHPGDSGQSVMEYFLHGYQTIPPERGVLLTTSYRLHRDICSFVSGAIYEGRLDSSAEHTQRFVRIPQEPSSYINKDSGIIFLPVVHEGNSQASEEEVDMILEVVAHLLGREFVDKAAGVSRPIHLNDILFVAPYNMQVNLLRSRLRGAKVGSVDKFQGQQAPVVILSMCASSVEDVPRGIDFLLSRNRLNVALTRAQSLAIVVGSPALKRVPCTSVEQVRLANVYCKLVRAGSD